MTRTGIAALLAALSILFLAGCRVANSPAAPPPRPADTENLRPQDNAIGTPDRPRAPLSPRTFNGKPPDAVRFEKPSR